MRKPSIDLTYDILATPQQVWTALTNGDVTAQYWCGMRVEADAWLPGARMRYVRGGRVTDEHTLVTVEPGERLTFQFHPVFTPQFMDEPPSLVDIQLSEHGKMTRLRLRHDGFPMGSSVYLQCQFGWPKVLDRLKIMMDSGRLVLPCDRLSATMESGYGGLVDMRRPAPMRRHA